MLGDRFRSGIESTARSQGQASEKIHVGGTQAKLGSIGGQLTQRRKVAMG
jgi:hypothetical protein